jgi:hypothetical protein
VDHHLLLFCEGRIGGGSQVAIEPRLSGVHDLIAEHPEKPVLLVRIEGLEPRAPLLQRLPVKVTIKRVNDMSVEGGPAGLIGRLENYFNHGTSPRRVG